MEKNFRVQINKLSSARWVFLMHWVSRTCIIFFFYIPTISRLWRFVPSACLTHFAKHEDFFYPLVTQIDCQSVPSLLPPFCLMLRAHFSGLDMSKQYVTVNQWSLINLLIDAQSKRQKLNKVLNFGAFAAKLAHESSWFARNLDNPPRSPAANRGASWART